MTARREWIELRKDIPFKLAKRQMLDRFEYGYVLDLLIRTLWNISAASRQSGISRKHLRTLIEKHRLTPELSLSHGGNR